MDFDTVVMKFGGSSVADPDKIKHVARRLVDAKQRGLRVVGTVSAMGKTTDGLIDLAHQVSPTPNVREFDMLLSTGERIACALVAMAIHDLGQEAVSLTGSQAGILTDGAHMKAKIREIRGDRVKDALDEDKIVLVAGFQGFSRDTMDVTTLGRGGTDATAVALAAALGAACEIYSDVPGVFTADPRIVPNARKLPTISYEEMLEMSASGAKVLMLRSVELARNHGVRIHARSTFSDEEGTWVQEGASMEQPIVSAVTHSENDVVFTLSDIPDRPGVAALIFDVVAAAHVNVDTIIQNVVHGNAEMSFSVPAEDVPATQARSRARAAELGAFTVEENHDLGKVSLIGAGMRSHPGRRGQDVPHARRQRDQPADDLDVADQDLLHDRPLGDPERGPRAARRVRAGERAACRSSGRCAGRLRRFAAESRERWSSPTAHTRRSSPASIGIVVVVAVRVTLDFAYNRYEKRLQRRDPGPVRPPSDDVPLRPARDRRPRRRDRRLERPVALRRHVGDREGAARVERRPRALRRSRLQHAALEPRLGPARRLHAAAPPRRPDHGRRRDGLRRGDGPDLHDARHRRRPAGLHPEHAADDEQDRQPHDQGPPAARRGALPRLDRDADRRGAQGAPRGDRDPARDERRRAARVLVGEIADRTVWLEVATYGPIDADVVSLASELRERGLVALRDKGFLAA